MKLEQNILVVNRIALIMTEELVDKLAKNANDKLAEAAKNNSDPSTMSLAYTTVILMAKLQQKVSFALAEENPEACVRGELLWTDHGALSTSALFIIASSADEEVLNHVEDHDYLNHLHTIKRVAEENGFRMSAFPVVANFPFKRTEIPADMQ